LPAKVGRPLKSAEAKRAMRASGTALGEGWSLVANEAVGPGATFTQATCNAAFKAGRQAEGKRKKSVDADVTYEAGKTKLPPIGGRIFLSIASYSDPSEAAALIAELHSIASACHNATEHDMKASAEDTRWTFTQTGGHPIPGCRAAGVDIALTWRPRGEPGDTLEIEQHLVIAVVGHNVISARFRRAAKAGSPESGDNATLDGALGSAIEAAIAALNL
jgi:hypothetical protein